MSMQAGFRSSLCLGLDLWHVATSCGRQSVCPAYLGISWS